MPERWERELRKLRDVHVPEPSVRERVERGPSSDHVPGRGERLTAGIVAVVVFLAAGAFAWQALAPGDGETAFAPGSWPVATVSFSTSAQGEPIATLEAGNAEQPGLIGAATSPEERYPYSWLDPAQLDDIARPLEVPMGSQLELNGNVTIKELLYGDAAQLDDGAGPDSGPIWSDQPDFSQPYYLPWNEEPERTYLKFFGTWPDGQVLDVYFEVRFVAPQADLADPAAEIVVTPEPMGAVFVYGGQRAPMAIDGGTYGGTSVTSELTGFDERAIVAKVPAGTPLRLSGEHLVDGSVRAGLLPFGEGGSSLDGAVPTQPGRYVLTVEVTWDGGSASFLHQIEVVPARETTAPSPAPSSPGSVVVDIRRSSEGTGDPGAIARFGTQEQWMCADHWTLVKPDGSSGNQVIFDCGQSDVFRATPGTPIEVTGDFATLSISAAVTGDQPPGDGDVVPSLDAGSVVTLAYDVTWDDGSEASFWLLLTVEGEASTDGSGIVVRIYGRGERAPAAPTATFTYAGKTRVACTQDFEWTLVDGTTVRGPEQTDVPECAGRAIGVPPGATIAIETNTAIRVTTTRTTTPFFEGDVGLVISATWPEGQATFIVPLTVATNTPSLELVVLDCRPEDQVPITGPDSRIEPAGSAYIVGNLTGFEEGDVVEQMTREGSGDAGDLTGVWQVVREGTVVASVNYPELSGVACEASGIGGG